MTLFAAVLVSFGTAAAAYVVLPAVMDVFRCPDAVGVFFAVVMLILLAALVYLDAALWIFAAAAWIEPQMQGPPLIQQALEVLQAARNQ